MVKTTQGVVTSSTYRTSLKYSICADYMSPQMHGYGEIEKYRDDLAVHQSLQQSHENVGIFVIPFAKN